MGTPEFAVPALEAVARVSEVAAVVTRPDRPRGRGRATGASAVAEAAVALGVHVMKPERVNDAGSRAELASLAPDLFAVVAFGAILSRDLLSLPRLGSINLHGSLLPEYRGASPVQQALWDGRTATGVTTMWMDEGLDTGDVALQRWTAIEPSDDAGTLANRLAALGAPLLAETLTLAHAGRAPRWPQPREGSSLTRRLTKRDGEVDWTLDAQTLWNRQRAVTPWPGATMVCNGKRIVLLRVRPLDLISREESPGTVVGVNPEGILVACGRGTLLIERVLPEGRTAMGAADWARGARLATGTRWGSPKEAHA
jgi:methionyl-tRNA formyltransferase